MHWAQTLDVSLFHLVNPALSSSWMDIVMPFSSGNVFFAPALLIGAILMLWNGGARGRLCVLMLLLIVAFGDCVVCHTLKHVINRPRPFLALADVHIPDGIGRTDSGSMPSAHAANWFAATMIAFIYYRRSLWFMLPLALLVSFSRIYNGVHYPSDIAVGAILGAGYAAGLAWTLDALWKWSGERWFPLWHTRMPSLLNPVVLPAPRELENDAALRERQWIHLAYALILIQLVLNLFYIGSGTISLSEDEAYQWVWSKHLALSYYSKPLMIALTQWVGTHIWGDTVFGVRFFAPVLGAITSLCLLRFISKVANARAAFWLCLIMQAVPVLVVGSTLMTIDPLSVMFWVLAMIAGWRAVQEDATTLDWFWVGLWMGLGFLSKYTGLFQLLSWILFFALHPPARKQLRRPGPYLALLANFICSIPVLIWNSQNHWITLKHVRQDGNLDKPFLVVLANMVHPANLWHGFSHYTLDFLAAEWALLNPFFFPIIIVTAIIFWRHKPAKPLLVYFFSMIAPIFMLYFLLTFNSRVLPNWIAPAIPPFFCLAVVYWEDRWRENSKLLKFCLVGGLICGLVMTVVLRDTDIISKFTGGYRVPAELDSTRRVKGWTETAELVEAARQKLLAEGKPVFIIGDHYGITGEMTFNIPEAKAAVSTEPLVYFRSSDVPVNQFYFWPGYKDRKGQNAIYLRELDLRETNMCGSIPEIAAKEFESVSNLGCVISMHEGRPAHRIQIIECRGLK